MNRSRFEILHDISVVEADLEAARFLVNFAGEDDVAGQIPYLESRLEQLEKELEETP